MDWIAALVTISSVVLSAVLGNLWVPKDALRWFRELRRPGWMIPFQGFLVVGLIYYVLMGVVLYRAFDRSDVAAIVLSFVVLVGNEAWNWLFFGRRSARAAFIGMIAFAVPVLALLAAVAEDPLSLVLVSVYFAWVLYDVAWTRALWRLNS
ncbi:TspO/MBR family protein (plasmid) [Streptomyces sp. BB1-1-1]|uniref:TspO/MBR family protein n=1 Tax=Streptomyces sp. BB1-1-1 TaxID=3074430 RepID=UPI002877B3D4|nr:TspO/MBR family protein [Streptomyces sp. BB1-1-1]WND32896.1 TspO/MBR family protein [Streptomyces sp. BB1-1-1]WND40035.1 TspO/MBR family protein [Streptomyces sp. BB1-1-1]WND40869.1 TspO/MBR family protein [Streptomyces sp. BB1-1-1]